MRNRQTHRAQLEDELRLLNDQIDRLQAFIDATSEGKDEKLAPQMRLEELRARRVNVQAMLLRNQEYEGTNLWEDVKAGLENVWDNVKTAVSNVAERLG